MSSRCAATDDDGVHSLNLDGWTLAFDLDGTLVETAPDLVGTLNAVLASEGLMPVPYESARNMVGHGARRLIEQGYAATGLPLSPELSPILFDRFIEHYRAHIADTSHPFPGCTEALIQLAAAGATLVVATNKRTDLALALLDALGMTHHFVAIIGADRAPAPKPDGRHIRFAIEQAGGDTAKALMVGDSLSDVAGARNAGVPVIGVSFGYTETPIRALGCEAVIDHYDELVGAIGRLVDPARDAALAIERR